MGDRDRYGGAPGLQFGGTGFFRLEHDSRWWLVTPEGNAFLSFGINHVEPGMLCRPYAIDHWRGELGDFEGPRDPALLKGFEAKVRRDLDAFGWNTLGCHSSIGHYSAPPCAYVHPIAFVPIAHWQRPTEADFHDVFSEDFEAHCDALARQHCAPREDDPFLLAYSFTDCPAFTDLDAAERGVCIYGNARPALPTWPRVLRNLDAEAPGKQAYVDTVRERHADDITCFNRAYGTSFGSFEELLRAEGWRTHVQPGDVDEEADNLAFLTRVVDRYYEVAINAIRRHDPNHRIFGDKLNMNVGVPDEIIEVVGRHADVLFYQHYGYYEQQRPSIERWHGLTGKPLLSGDSSFSCSDENMSFPLGPHQRSQEARAEAFTEYARAIFARPERLGWHWCGWIDSWEVFQPGRQHSGVQTAFGEYHEPLRRAMREFSGTMYGIANGEPA